MEALGQLLMITGAIGCLITGIFLLIAAFQEGVNSGDFWWIMLLLVVPLFNIFVIYSKNADKESLFSLWVEVRKKKLKDQLDK